MSKLLVRLDKYILGPWTAPASAEILNSSLETVRQSVVRIGQPQEFDGLVPGAYLISSPTVR